MLSGIGGVFLLEAVFQQKNSKPRSNQSAGVSQDRILMVWPKTGAEKNYPAEVAAAGQWRPVKKKQNQFGDGWKPGNGEQVFWKDAAAIRRIALFTGDIWMRKNKTGILPAIFVPYQYSWIWAAKIWRMKVSCTQLRQPVFLKNCQHPGNFKMLYQSPGGWIILILDQWKQSLSIPAPPKHTGWPIFMQPMVWGEPGFYTISNMNLPVPMPPVLYGLALQPAAHF